MNAASVGELLLWKVRKENDALGIVLTYVQPLCGHLYLWVCIR